MYRTKKTSIALHLLVVVLLTLVALPLWAQGSPEPAGGEGADTPTQNAAAPEDGSSGDGSQENATQKNAAVVGQDPAPETVETISGTLVQDGPPEAAVQLGQPIDLTLSVAHPPNVTVTLPDSFGTGRWELLSSTAKTIEAEKQWTTVLDLRFAVYRPGETTLEPFPIDLVGTRGEGRIYSEPVTVTVLSALEAVDGEPGFAAPRAAVPVWVEDHSLALALGFGGLSLLLGFFFFWYRRRTELAAPAPPPRPPHEVALARLGELAADDLVERGEHMLFYVRLSETIREYLGRRYGFKGVEMTTTEILDALDRSGVDWPPAVSRDDIADFLLHCDAVKFGGFVPSAQVASEKLRRAFTVVESTKEAPVVRPTPSEADAPDSAASGSDAPGSNAPGSNGTGATQDDADSKWRPPSETSQDEPAQNEMAQNEAAQDEPAEAEPPGQDETAAQDEPDAVDESDEDESEADEPAQDETDVEEPRNGD